MPGTLYVVATPIGNLQDFGERAMQTLMQVDLIASEDTRVTRKLLDHFGVKTPTTSLHKHSSCAKEESLIREIAGGTVVAMVTDAGTPAISDPGSKFIEMAVKAGIDVIPIPGASALTTALCVSGFQTRPFTFYGFPPTKKGRTKFFDVVNQTKHTSVLYESKHRIVKTLEAIDPSRSIMLARELTKKHETIYRGTPPSVIQQLEQGSSKGEFVIVIGPKSSKLL